MKNIGVVHPTSLLQAETQRLQTEILIYILRRSMTKAATSLEGVKSESKVSRRVFSSRYKMFKCQVTAWLQEENQALIHSETISDTSAGKYYGAELSTRTIIFKVTNL